MRFLLACYNIGSMINEFDIAEMRTRLADELDRQRRSRDSVCLAAGLSAGYLTNILTRGQVPTVSKLSAICSELGVSIAYIMYGYDISPDSLEVLELLQQQPEKQDAILKLLRG